MFCFLLLFCLFVLFCFVKNGHFTFLLLTSKIDEKDDQQQYLAEKFWSSSLETEPLSHNPVFFLLWRIDSYRGVQCISLHFQSCWHGVWGCTVKAPRMVQELLEVLLDMYSEVNKKRLFSHPVWCGPSSVTFWLWILTSLLLSPDLYIVLKHDSTILVRWLGSKSVAVKARKAEFQFPAPMQKLGVASHNPRIWGQRQVNQDLTGRLSSLD